MRYDKAEFKAAYGTFGQLPDSDLPEIAFAGRSNVGKSSLLNRLFQRKNLARVSSVPGKTITINFYQVDEVNFVDSKNENPAGQSSYSAVASQPYVPESYGAPTYTNAGAGEAPKFEEITDDDELPF